MTSAERNDLTERIYAFAVRRARKYYQVSIEDLVQETMLRLLPEINEGKINESCFENFTVVSMKDALGEMIRQKQPAQLPYEVISACRRVQRVEDSLARVRVRAPTAEEIALEMVISRETCLRLLGWIYSMSPVSLDAPMTDDADSGALVERFASGENGPEAIIETRDLYLK